MYFRKILLVVLIVAVATSCSDPNESRRQLLQIELQQIENNYSLRSQELAIKQQQANNLQQRIQEYRLELSDYNRRVEAYIMNHKMAIAAMAAGAGGAAVAYDPNNEFSDEVQGTAGVVGAIAALWALGNLGEITEVADQLMQADKYVKSLETQIVSTQRELQAVSEPIPQLRNTLDLMQETYDSHMVELESLR